MQIEVKGMAYINNSVWIASLKAQLELKVKIVESFFSMSGITVNSNKSELIVINAYKKGKLKEKIIENDRQQIEKTRSYEPPFI